MFTIYSQFVHTLFIIMVYHIDNETRERVQNKGGKQNEKNRI